VIRLRSSVVLIEGRLVTHQADAADTAASGRRFAAADDGKFVCPQCGAVMAGDFCMSSRRCKPKTQA
jgi:predicted RNA-binding Zn-ribbon protein involved in translation (DUF1610 family)